MKAINSGHSFRRIGYPWHSRVSSYINKDIYSIRRRLIGGAVFGSLLAFGPRVRAQASQKIVRIGVMAGKSDSAYKASFAATLAALGWIEGKNLIIEWRQVDQPADVAGHAAALMALRPDVLVTAGPRITQEIAKLTTAIPIVFLAVADPVKLGVVRSLPFPGGNLTGFQTVASNAYVGKLLQLLMEVAPGTTRIGMLIATGNEMHKGGAERAKPFATQLHASVTALNVDKAEALEGAFDAGSREGVQALLVPGDLLFSATRERIAALAIKHRLPSIFMFPYYVDAGGLLSYGISVDALFRSAAGTVNKILKGARPQDIPVEQPTRFEMVINLKTARALGLKISQAVLLRADRVIE